MRSDGTVIEPAKQHTSLSVEMHGFNLLPIFILVHSFMLDRDHILVPLEVNLACFQEG